MARHTQLDWPDGIERTPPAERERTTKFSATIGDTTQALAKEMDRMDSCTSWYGSIANAHSKSNGLPLHNADPDDPAFVLRWTSPDGQPHAVACDHYADLSDNLRAVYLWVNETRLRGQRPVATAADAFAAAALPPGDSSDTDAVALGTDEQPAEPHEILEVSPSANPGVVKAAARSKKADAHPDSDTDSPYTVDQVRRAQEAMLDGY